MRATMKAFLATILWSLALACAPALVPQPVAPCPTPSSNAANNSTVVGVVNGSEIRRSALDSDLDVEIKRIENEARQRQLHVTYLAIDGAINEMLVEQEARRLGMGVPELRQKEIEGKLVMPTDEEIRAIYDDNQDVINVSFEEAAPHIKQQLARERFAELYQVLVERLRDNADIRLALPIPELPRFDVEPGDAPMWGSKNAKITIIEFSDFECPYCGRASRTLKQLRELYPNSLRIFFRDFPLPQHPNARSAAEAAQCAREQGKFWEYHDKLYDHSRNLSASDLKEYAEDLDLNMTAFSACLASERPKAIVAAHAKAARQYKIDGTPAIFINGIKLIGLLPLQLIRAIIDRELGTP
jgi:predicted DsbA family dithiol-disulfide isomerase